MTTQMPPAAPRPTAPRKPARSGRGRFRALAGLMGLAVAAAGLTTATAAHASSDGTSSIAAVSTTWSGGTATVKFTYDTWDYGRVGVVVGGASAGTRVLPTFADGRASISFPRATTAGAAPIRVTMTSCDGDPGAADGASVPCTTSTAYTGVLLVARSVPKGKANALTLLDGLPVRKESHASTYRRSKFTLWIDANGDGESTRAEVLKAESVKRVTENSHHTVETGKWVSRYDGKTFTVGSKLDIDHLVPLEEAWTSGASGWSARRREAYANDLGNAASLIAVSAHANRSKGDKDPSGYLPPLKSYDCTYVRDYIAVKARWKLSVDSAEKTAMSTVLATCSSYAVAKPGTPDIAALLPKKHTTSGGSASGSGSSSGGTSSGGSTGSVYYANCDAVRAAGKAPLYRGQPGYAYPRLDRDGDGVACE